MAEDPQFPAEFRKLFGIIKPEKQNQEFVIDDERSSKHYKDMNE